MTESNIRVEVAPDGRYELIISEENGNHRHSRRIDFEALAAYGELLRYGDVVDTVEALIAIMDCTWEPPADPRTQENPWTAGYRLLRHRETEREKEAIQAIQEGTANDPRSPRLRGALKARECMTTPVGAASDKGCALSQYTDQLRSFYQAPPPTRMSSHLRGGTLTCTSERAPEAPPGPCDREALAQALEPYVEEIRRARVNFLHGLTPADANPLECAEGVLEQSHEGPTDVTLEDVFARYQGEGAA